MKKQKKQYNLKNDRSCNTKYIALMITHALYKKLKIVCIDKNITTSEYIRELLEKAIENELKGE